MPTHITEDHLAFAKMGETLLSLSSPSQSNDTVSARSRHFSEPLLWFLLGKHQTIGSSSTGTFVELLNRIEGQPQRDILDEARNARRAFYYVAQSVHAFGSACKGAHASVFLASDVTDSLMIAQCRWLFQYLFKQSGIPSESLGHCVDNVLNRMTRDSSSSDFPMQIAQALQLGPAGPSEIATRLKQQGVASDKTTHPSYIRVYLKRNTKMFCQTVDGKWALTSIGKQNTIRGNTPWM